MDLGIRDRLKITWTSMGSGFWARLRRAARRHSQSYFEGGPTKGWPKRPSMIVQVIFRRSLTQGRP